MGGEVGGEKDPFLGGERGLKIWKVASRGEDFWLQKLSGDQVGGILVFFQKKVGSWNDFFIYKLFDEISKSF